MPHGPPGVAAGLAVLVGEVPGRTVDTVAVAVGSEPEACTLPQATTSAPAPTAAIQAIVRRARRTDDIIATSPLLPAHNAPCQLRCARR